MSDKGIENLCVAVLRQAVDDYGKAVQTFQKEDASLASRETAEKMYLEVNGFFSSRLADLYLSLISDMSADDIAVVMKRQFGDIDITKEQETNNRMRLEAYGALPPPNKTRKKVVKEKKKKKREEKK